MKGVAEVLQLPIIIKRCGFPSSELETFQKFELLFGCIAAEGCILEKRFQSGRLPDRHFSLPLNELEFLPMTSRQSSVQHNVHPESFEVDVPGLDQRIQKRHAVCDR